MRRLSQYLKTLDWKKMKLAGLTGLAAGTLVVLILASQDNHAASLDGRNLAEGLAKLASLLPPLGDTAVPKMEEVEKEQVDPSVFLDKSMEMLAQAVEGTDQSVLTLKGGEKLRFTIDPAIQAAVEAEYARFQPEAAGFVALDPHTGEILALTGYSQGETAPHRALEAEGPAASLFKVVTASALVEEHRISPAKQVCYHGGGSSIPKRLLTPDPNHDSTCVTFSQAMGKSANVVFARLADQNLSKSEMSDYVTRFWFNKVIPFPWPVELSKADVPDDKVERARMAAGFYHATISPLHAALLAATVANGGVMPQPQIVKEVVLPDGDVAFRTAPRELGRAISERTASTLSAMMLTTTREGTAAKYFGRKGKTLSGIDVAGKTGSLSKTIDGNRFHYSWFIGFAPADNPQVAFASLVVNGPKWKVKGPFIARKALDEFFKHATQRNQTAGR